MALSDLGRFLRLTSAERALFLRTVRLLATARVTTWVLPFRVARRFLTRARAREMRGGVTHEQVRWAVSRARAIVPMATCLPQALAAESLLMRDGHKPLMHIGVRKTPAGRLEAHAWVECEGKIVVGNLPEGFGAYTKLPPLPAAWNDSDSR